MHPLFRVMSVDLGLIRDMWTLSAELLGPDWQVLTESAAAPQLLPTILGFA